MSSPSFFKPFIKSNCKEYSSFPVKILQLFDESMHEKLLERGYEKEIINYAGNIESFTFLGDLTEIKTLDVLRETKNKIVLLGYTGIHSPYPTSNDNFDAHSTAMGEMFGVVILANILHTIMGNYITPLSSVMMTLVVLIVALLNVLITFTRSKKASNIG